MPHANQSEKIYEDLRLQLEAAGLKPYRHRKGQLVVTRTIPPLPSGNSFWVTFRKNHWYLVTWAPKAYRLPKTLDIKELCLRCVAAERKGMDSLSQPILLQFQLEELSDSELDFLLRSKTKSNEPSRRRKENPSAGRGAA